MPQRTQPSGNPLRPHAAADANPCARQGSPRAPPAVPQKQGRPQPCQLGGAGQKCQRQTVKPAPAALPRTGQTGSGSSTIGERNDKVPTERQGADKLSGRPRE